MTEPRELIVEGRMLEAVITQLETLGVWSKESEYEKDDLLRLALIRNLDNLPGYAAETRRRYWNEIETLQRRNDRDFTDLDVLLYDLRTRFGAETGVVPLLGKNRDTFIGYPQHKNYGDPRPMAAPSELAPVGHVQGDIRVGVVDTPLYMHPFFTEELVETDAVSTPAEDGTFGAWQGHSTFVTGIIHQFAPDAHIVVKAGLDGGTGRNTVWATAKKIAAFTDEHEPEIRVLNLSFGTTTEDAQPPLALRRAIQVVRKKFDKLVIVAAAGNRGHRASPPLAIWPAAMTEVVAVGATGASFSMDRDYVDVTSDGIDVRGLYLDGEVRLSRGLLGFDGYAVISGTSFAAARVSGLIAEELKTESDPVKALQNLVQDGRATPYRPA
jgi:hypothetical protein